MRHIANHAAGLYIALLHFPVLNKEGKVVTTSVANMDIHDIARTAKTYGVQRFYLVNPVAAQRELAFTIMGHWQKGAGATANPDRKAAFELVSVQTTLDETIADINRQQGRPPKLVATGANFRGDLLSCDTLGRMIERNDLPYLLIFGTGSGLAPDVTERVDYRLEPITGARNYNHLPVRAAVAVMLDRIMNINYCATTREDI